MASELRRQWREIGPEHNFARLTAWALIVLGIAGACLAGVLGMQYAYFQKHSDLLIFAISAFVVGLASIVTGNWVWFTLRKSARAKQPPRP